MSKLTTAEIKDLIVAEATKNSVDSILDPCFRVPVKELNKEKNIKNWRREIKKSFKDEKVTLRVFECWVGWNNLHAVVKTPYPEDDTILSLEINLFDGFKHMKHKFYETL